MFICIIKKIHCAQGLQVAGSGISRKPSPQCESNVILAYIYICII